MTILGIQAMGDAVGASPSGKLRPPGVASFADLMEEQEPAEPALSPAEIKDRDRAHIMKRIVEVGFAQAMKEEHDKQKMMRVLTVMEAQSPPDMRAVLTKIGEDFERNPPDGQDDMLSRIQARIDHMPPDLPNRLKQRLIGVFAKIKELMALPEDKLKQIEAGLGLA